MATVNSEPVLTRDELRRILGPVDEPGPLDLRVEEEVQCGGHVRRKVSYNVPAGRVSAFVGIPDGLTRPVPVVFCHHQHNGEFDLGKSEVWGLRGAPDQAYATELAERGFVTIAPDAIGFEERNWAAGANVTWFELSARLVVGRTLLAACLQEISLALDYATSLPQVDAARIGFIGHSYGGRAAMWAPAWDDRIRVSVSNCGCIPYRDSFARDAGFQAEFVIPGFASSYDVEDVIAVGDQCQYLIVAADDDVWSRGAARIRANLAERGSTHARVHVRPGHHDFPDESRRMAYEFLVESLI
jgi:dienelactone hydrolase